MIYAIPSIALVLCFNIADLQAYVQFNSPAPVKVFFSVLYCLYALLGIAVAVVLPKVVPPRRFKPLIALYWVVITMTILEGVYFGIVMSKQKSKFIDYCDNGPSTPAPTPTIVPAINGTASAVEVKSTHQTPKPLVCRNGHAVVGLLYIMGPGGWIALHIGWILMVVLYSKALRRQYPIEDDYEEFPPHRNVLALSLSAHKSQNQSFSSRPTSSYPLGGAKAFQGGIGGMPGGDKDKKGSEQDRRFSAGRWNAGPLFWQVSKGRSQPDTHQMHSIDGDDALSDSADFEHRVPPAKESEEEGEDSDEDVDGADQDWHSDQSTPHRRGSSSPEGSLSSRTDIPADGKGWWIRQIEGKRRGEICPCTIGSSSHLHNES
ncbi:hypothetical protein BGZ83_005925 [Gryganskiella cystojenkinii]|nr:hypothetical protein BGZ83_005925 [Gryganskiella cystojenkinii]